MTSLADLTTFYVTLPADFKNYLEAEGMFPEDVMKKTQLKEEDVHFVKINLKNAIYVESARRVVLKLNNIWI